MTTAAQLQAFFGTLPTVSSNQGAYGAYRLEAIPASRLGPLVADANRGWLPVDGTDGGYRVTGNPAKGTWLESVAEFAAHNAPLEETFALEYTPNYFGSRTAENQAIAANDKESAIIQAVGMAITGAGLSGAFGGQSLWSSVSATPGQAAGAVSAVDEAGLVSQFSQSLAPASDSWGIWDAIKTAGGALVDLAGPASKIVGGIAAIAAIGGKSPSNKGGSAVNLNQAQVPGGAPAAGATPQNVNVNPQASLSPWLILAAVAAFVVLGE